MPELYNPENHFRTLDSKEERESKQANRLAKYAGRLAEADVIERPILARLDLWDLIKKSVLWEYEEIPDEVFDKANELLIESGIRISHGEKGSPFTDYEQTMTIQLQLAGCESADI